MPMPVKDLIKFEGYENIEILITNFLEKNKENAYLEREIYEELHGSDKLLNFKNIGDLIQKFTRSLYLSRTLEGMVKDNKIKIKIVENKKYYYLE